MRENFVAKLIRPRKRLLQAKIDEYKSNDMNEVNSANISISYDKE